MSNIIPQKHELNGGPWRSVEDLIASKGGYAEKFAEVWVICGGIYDEDKQFINNKIEIPDECYMIIVDLLNGEPRVMAFIMPQFIEKRTKLDEYLTTVDEIESRTGLDFMPDLEDKVENKVEEEKSNKLWR